MNQRSVDFVDLIKLIASIMIFAMHGTVFRDYGNMQLILEIATRWGVPFFFICSSFFLFNAEKGDLPKIRVKHFCKRIGTLYIAWFFVNAPQIVYSRFYLNGMLKPSTYIKFIYCVLFSSTYTGSWYMASSIYAACIIYFLSKRLSTKQMLMVTSVTQLICIFTSAYNAFLPVYIASMLKENLSFLSTLFGGCFYFAVGKYIVENKRILVLIPLKVYCYLLVIAYILSFSEMFLVIQKLNRVETDASFGIIPVAMILFIICLKVRRTIPKHKVLRKISTINYCGQGNILIAKSVISKVFGISSSIMSFIVAGILMAVLIFVILFLQKSRDKGLIQYLT